MPATPAEYKHITVLFADVVRSMDIAATLGPERLRTIMADLVSRSAAVVHRYGGTVDKFTGDGIMALFGAPKALEDHALRACLAALDIQAEAGCIAQEVRYRDGIELQLRIGLNSGQVIAGDLGSGPMGYTAMGEQVGMAQRMESAAPPGGVLLSESTARLVEASVMLADTGFVQIKGFPTPVAARRLIGIAEGPRPDRMASSFVGREWEMSALAGMVERALNGKGGVVGVVGPPGIGKSRMVREAVEFATAYGADVFTTYCESHTSDIPFHAAAGLLREAVGVADLDAAAARDRVRAEFSDADNEDLVLVDDLLGIGDPNVIPPPIDPDARRRRGAALVKAASLARPTTAVYVIEDAHWIDEVSESMLAEFLSVMPQTRSLVIVTYRPEYFGALAHSPRSQTLALEPLDDAHIAKLSSEMLGTHRSVLGLPAIIARRAAGNPFFAEEIVRDLAEQEVLIGRHGDYVCAREIADVSVPATLQSVIAARIDRLNPAAKRTLNAAAVIGSRFSPTQLDALGVDPSLDQLVRAELIDQTSFTPSAEFAFRHPLIRAVAYESQLTSDRSALHRRVATTIERDDANAALIAEHLQAAGDLQDAYVWHMRAGGWSADRNTAAAQISWERARQVADELPADEPNRLAMRIAPRTLLCGSAWRRIHEDISTRFEELRELCTEADDKTSLAIAMSGLAMENIHHSRIPEASRLAAEAMALVDASGDPMLVLDLFFSACVAQLQAAEMTDVLRWTDTVIELAQHDRAEDDCAFAAPLATALVFRAVAGWCTGRENWRADLDRATALACHIDPVYRATVIAYKYIGIPRGVQLVDDAALAEIEEALQIAVQTTDDIALVLVNLALGVALVHHGPASRQRGYEVLARLRESCVEQNYGMNAVPMFDLYGARRMAESGDLDGAIDRLRAVSGDIYDTRNLGNSDIATAMLVETLLERGTDDDLIEAEAAIDTMMTTLGSQLLVSRDVMVARLRTLVACARGDMAAYRGLKEQYRALATRYDCRGHLVWLEAMP